MTTWVIRNDCGWYLTDVRRRTAYYSGNPRNAETYSLSHAQAMLEAHKRLLSGCEVRARVKAGSRPANFYDRLAKDFGIPRELAKRCVYGALFPRFPRVGWREVHTLLVEGGYMSTRRIAQDFVARVHENGEEVAKERLNQFNWSSLQSWVES